MVKTLCQIARRSLVPHKNDVVESLTLVWANEGQRKANYKEV
jgi:hypothetical protein